MITKISNIAIAIKDETAKEPHWTDVRDRLKYYMETKIDPATLDDDEPLSYAVTHKVPERNTIRKFLDKVKYPPTEEDAPWSMGISSAVGIPDDALGALSAMWSWSLVQAFDAPFTIRIARWVSRFRWLPTSGGSVRGEALVPLNLYVHSTLYAAMERLAEATMDKRGMRTPVMDIELLLPREVRSTAEKLGFLSEWGAEWKDVDDAYRLQNTEFEAYAPEVFAYARKQSAYEAGVLNVDAPIAAVAEILGRIDESERRVVEPMWSLAIKKAQRHPQWNDLPVGHEQVVSVNMLASLSDAYALTKNVVTGNPGALMDWEPAIDKLIAEALVNDGSVQLWPHGPAD